jgi:hypothetical protein
MPARITARVLTPPAVLGCANEGGGGAGGESSLEERQVVVPFESK